MERSDKDAGFLVAGGGRDWRGHSRSVDQDVDFLVADNRFHVEGSYETFEGLHGIVAVPFISVGAIISMKVGLRSALPAFAAQHQAALVVVLIANGMGWS